MSLADEVREILNIGPAGDGFPCKYCCFIPHQDECAWLAMPQIVAALEIVKELAECDAPAALKFGSIFCALCDAPEPIGNPEDHEPSCLWRRAREAQG